MLHKSERFLLWAGDKNVGKALSTFATQYKRSKDCISHGRTQYPLMPKYGKEECMEYTKKYIEPFVNISQVAGGSQFMDNVWFFGYMPGHIKLSLPHNCAGVVKAVACGEVHVVLFDIVTLLKFTKDEQLEGYGKLEDVMASLEKCTEEKLTSMSKGGVVIYQHTLVAAQLLFIPMGYVIMERASAKETLIYGVRRSFFKSSDRSRESYSAMRQLFAASGKPTSRMDELLALMS